jgi:hypothetical protein
MANVVDCENEKCEEPLMPHTAEFHTKILNQLRTAVMKTSGCSLWETKYYFCLPCAWWAGTSIPITGVPGLYCTDTENRYCLTAGIRIISKILIGIIVGVQAYQV